MEDTLVQNFYNDWPYPALEDLSLGELVKLGYRDKSDPSKNWDFFFPEIEKNEKIIILIAGCGTYQAGFISIANPNATVVGLDLSSKSIEKQKELCFQENLDNIELHVSSILKFDDIRKFDYIICTGILHHTQDPVKNMQKLSSLLSPKGKIYLSVYNESIRHGVDKIQNLIKLLNFNTTIDTAQKISDTIGQLKNHTLQKYISKNTELKFLNNFIDTFFHPREQSFNPLTLKKLINQTDLKFEKWINDNYNVDVRLGKMHPLYEDIIKLDIFEQAFCIDLIKEDSSTIDVLLTKRLKEIK